jgi:hypothetical protein
MNDGDTEIPGIMVYGAVGMLVSEELEISHSGNYVEERQHAEITGDPVWFDADTIDKLIQDGTWNVNSLENVACIPDVEEWPSRWRELAWKRWREYERKRDAGQN